MPLRKKNTEPVKEQPDIRADDFLYNDTDTVESITGALPGTENRNDSDTPDEAVRKLRSELGTGDEEEKTPESRKKRTDRRKEQAADKTAAKPARQVPRFLRYTFLTIVTLVLLAMIAASGFSNMYPDVAILQKPAQLVAQIMTPIQTYFSTGTEGIFGYFRLVKRRAGLEEAYNKLREENETLVYQAMRVEELEIQLKQFENIYDEMSSNRNMNPISCTVIGRGDSNYFNTFTINRGSNDGIEPYMAVTYGGSLIGYTENVMTTKSDVRTIIDSEASIAALLQSSRDQGTIRGTLGVDGTASCRMYYLPDDNLPRPGDVVVTSGVGMSFPKGIPIGEVKESTRGMESNKSYIVVKPYADFEHIEYVIVLRYKPAAEAVQGRSSISVLENYVELETARPYPTLQLGTSLAFGETAAPTETPAPTPTPEPTPEPTETPVATVTPVPTETPLVYEYVPINQPTATPSPEPTEEPTPYITLTPGGMTYEEDN